jgi:hypothetical protein
MAAFVKVAWRYLRLAIGGFMVLVAVVSPLVPKPEHLERYERLEAEGVKGAGQVTSLWIYDDKMSTIPLRGLGGVGRVGGAVIAGQRLDRAIDGENPAKRDVLTTTDYHVAYSFQPPGGAVIEYQTTVTDAQYKRLSVGAPVDVLYHPGNPSIHRLPAYSKPMQAITLELKLMGSLFGAVVGGLLIWGAWPRRGSVPSGEPAPARVQSVARASSSSHSPVARNTRSPQSRSEFGRRS